mmetsp:Transcript_95155/g.174365  ORF Transcript_95155/g.174365 Transcript_95155/m.174365 type:complete len:307 (-) Transcript_95155:156-1076(-)
MCLRQFLLARADPAADSQPASNDQTPPPIPRSSPGWQHLRLILLPAAGHSRKLLTFLPTPPCLLTPRPTAHPKLHRSLPVHPCLLTRSSFFATDVWAQCSVSCAIGVGCRCRASCAIAACSPCLVSLGTGVSTQCLAGLSTYVWLRRVNLMTGVWPRFAGVVLKLPPGASRWQPCLALPLVWPCLVESELHLLLPSLKPAQALQQQYRLIVATCSLLRQRVSAEPTAALAPMVLMALTVSAALMASAALPVVLAPVLLVQPARSPSSRQPASGHCPSACCLRAAMPPCGQPAGCHSAAERRAVLLA